MSRLSKQTVLWFDATMKRRNFLSGLLAAPLALKARLARFFVRKPGELCGAALIHVLVPSPYQFSRNQSLRNRQSEILQLMAQGKIDEGVASRQISKLNEEMSRAAARHRVRKPLGCYCSLPRGHKGPHVLLNPR